MIDLNVILSLISDMSIVFLYFYESKYFWYTM